MVATALHKQAQTTHFTEEELSLLDQGVSPRHVAIIMDGNRRWARRNNPLKISSHLKGHAQGAETFSLIVEAAIELGIQELTAYAFSTENWNRSPLEIKVLHKILESHLQKNREKMKKNGVCFQVIGDITPFPAAVKREIKRVVIETRDNTKLQLTLALNYGARDEICRAMRKIAQQKIAPDEITEEVVAAHLDTAALSDPDLLIRTSGEMRISNFLLWQLAYAEVYVTKTLWPDFTPHDLLKAVLEFQNRERRLGI
ncbi:MAG: polyprenyl diphosphate synthase [Chlamydiales bacterium]